MVGQLVRVTGAGYHAAFEALAENHGNMDAAVSALTCAPELSAAAADDSTNFGARTELPAPERGVTGDHVTEPVQDDEGDGDGSNSGSSNAAPDGGEQAMLAALMAGVP